jgi:F-type H+-transporting ATPase subunit delta
MSDNQQSGFDPGREHLGEVYAQALLGAAEKAGVTEAVVAELGSFVEDVLDKLPQIRMTLFSLRVTPEEKAAILDKAFGGKMSVQLLNFLKVLARHQRMDAVRYVLRSAQKQLNKLRGREEVYVTSATPIPADKLDQVKAKIGQIKELQGKELVLHVKVDPELLGGIKVRVGDKLFDSSLATQLQRMKDVALDHTEQKIRQSLGRFVSGGVT